MTGTIKGVPSPAGFGVGIDDVTKAIDFYNQNKGLINSIVNLFKGIFGHKKPPAGPITEPIPAPGSPSDFPDDHIPAPATPSRSVVTLELKLSRAQYSKERFPEEYTAQNPFGLVSQERLRAIERGEANLNWGSKFWLDLTARDANGNEYLRDAIVAKSLAFTTELHAGEAFIKGHGANTDGSLKEGYETNDTDAVGNGISAYISSNGFLHQMKAHSQGEFECWGRVAGIESNHFVIKVK